MRANLLVGQFEGLVQTPEDVKQLEGAILDLAVRGLLVPQDPENEPASVLLGRNILERDRLVREGTVRRLAELPPISSDEIPYGLPGNWIWCRIGEVTTYGSSDTVGPEEVEAGTWLLDLEDIEKSTSRLLSRQRLGDSSFKSTKRVFKAGEVLYGKLRPYLDKVIVADEDGICTTEIMSLHGYVDIDPYYLIGKSVKHRTNLVETIVV